MREHAVVVFLLEKGYFGLVGVQSCAVLFAGEEGLVLEALEEVAIGDEGVVGAALHFQDFHLNYRTIILYILQIKCTHSAPR